MSVSAPGAGARFAAWCFAAARPLCERLATLESRVVADAIDTVTIRQPVFIAGLARAGSTILLEMLASGRDFASLRYCDYPQVWFPYWWESLRRRLPLPTQVAQPRAHGDGIAVTPESPEAFDEGFWMHFFARRHDPKHDQRLDAPHAHPRFDAFYRAQIRKVLAVRDRPRYLCKGNYNLARLPYLHALFPDARFIVPIRAPEAHVASLCSQHRRFRELAERARGVASYLARSGHFEFGPQRRAECVGDVAEGARIEAAFAMGDDIEGYARQWAMSYGALHEALERAPGLAEATLLVRHEDLCISPEVTLRELAQHCILERVEEDRLVGDWAPRLQTHEVSSARIDAAGRDRIQALTAGVAERFGYRP
jgi:hypothetical protein